MYTGSNHALWLYYWIIFFPSQTWRPLKCCLILLRVEIGKRKYNHPSFLSLFFPGFGKQRNLNVILKVASSFTSRPKGNTFSFVEMLSVAEVLQTPFLKKTSTECEIKEETSKSSLMPSDAVGLNQLIH